MLSSLKDLRIGRIRRNYFCASVGIKQVGTFEVTQVPLAVVAIADQASWRVVGKGFELGSKLPAFTPNFHGAGPSLGRSATNARAAAWM
jgi:hypothetical protein